jgi:hypothetical protein
VKRSGRVVWAAALLVGLLALTFWAGRRLGTGSGTPLTCCLQDAGTGGGLAIARWASRMGYHVQPLEQPVWEATRAGKWPKSGGNVIVTAGDDDWSPWGRDMTDDDWQATEQWVGARNALIVVTSKPESLPAPLLGALGRTKEKKEFSVDLAAALGANTATKQVITDAGDKLIVRSAGPRWHDMPPDQVIAGDDGGAVLFRVPVEAGSIYLLLDDHAWVNEGFDAGDNALVLAKILERELSGGTLAIDEYRHGHGQSESLAVFAMALPGATTFVWIGLLLVGFYVYGKNRRFGPPEPFVERERRTAAEYIDSLASLYQRAVAVPLVVRAVAGRLRFLAAQRGRFDAEADTVLQQAEPLTTLVRNPENNRDGLRTVTRLIQERKRLYGS